MRSFYAPFVRKGDLVFDVGAHIGRHAEIFTDLGAKVVAIEPNPRCCEQLARLAKVRDIRVESCAAGDAPGKLKLRICQDSVISTVVDAWYEGARRSPIHQDAHWLESLEIDVVTLDQLANRYGIPAFVKIDAEGYDDHVLRGMSFRPQALCFEYNRLLPEVAARCLEMPALSAGYKFNFSRGLDLKNVSKDWMSAQDIGKHLSDFAADEEYGDVFARSIALSDRTAITAVAQGGELQGRDRNGQHIHAKEQIFAKPAGTHSRWQIDVRQRHQPRFNAQCFRSPQPFERPLLQHAQQLALRRR